MQNIKTIKRDGSIVSFDKLKIETAISKANKNVSDEDKIDDILIEYLSKKIEKDILSSNKNEDEDIFISVESIQDMVENELVSLGKYQLSKEYILYRYKRGVERNKEKEIINKFKNRVQAKDVQNSNANVDERSFSGREKEASSDISKAYAVEFGGLSEKTAKAHKEMLIYQHDLEKAIYGIHNCLNANLQELFTHGFKTRNGDVRPPASFSTACQLVAVIFQCQSQVQFGE